MKLAMRMRQASGLGHTHFEAGLVAAEVIA